MMRPARLGEMAPNADPRQALDEGVRYQKAGALDGALERFQRAASSAKEPSIVSEALRRLASVHRTRCEWEKSLDTARRSGEVARAADLTDLLAEALNAEAAVHRSRGDFALAVPILEQILTTTSNERIRGIALQNLGGIAAESKDLLTAETHFLESQLCFQRAGYLPGEAYALHNYGRVIFDRGNVEEAGPVMQRAMDVAKKVGDLDLLALATLTYAELLAHQQQITKAEELVSSAHGYFTITGNTYRRIECLRFLGDMSLQQQNTATAARCFREGLRLAQEIGAKVEVSQLSDRLAALPEA
jgi:tetratricopeptide (TPR) repeat protein